MAALEDSVVLRHLGTSLLYHVAVSTKVRQLTLCLPSSQFSPRVSFDTFANGDASDFSLTLNRKHREYVYTKRSRTFLCGTDANDYSDTALEWLIDELVDDGDEVVCLRVVEKDSKEAIKWGGGGAAGGREGKETREIRERAYIAEAQKTIKRIEDRNVEDKAINLVLEFSIGKVPDTIQHMVCLCFLLMITFVAAVANIHIVRFAYTNLPF